MRHRICPSIGFGNPEKELLDNKGEVPTAMADEAIDLYFRDWEGCDFSVTKDKVVLGIEPTYQYQKLRIVAVCRNINDSYFQTGCAFGAYGSQLVKKTKKYSEYKNKSKFVKFVEKWHPVLFGVK